MSCTRIELEVEMEQSYSCSIKVNKSPEVVFNKIMQVELWWSEDIKGKTVNTNDIFNIQFVFGDSFVIKVVESIPNKKIVWLVTDCNLTWIKDSKEWKETRIIFEILEGEQTEIRFTHIWLIPGIECYEGCSKGWNYFIKESLFGFINDGIGKPDRKK